MSWFSKNFPDGSGFPDFLFEWIIILFKTGRLKEAEKKAFQTFCRNTYLFEKFFNEEIIPLNKWEGSNLEVAEFAKSSFDYTHSQDNLTDFSAWLTSFIKSGKFIQQSNKLIEINKSLISEHDIEKRRCLIRQARQLEEDW